MEPGRCAAYLTLGVRGAFRSLVMKIKSCTRHDNFSCEGDGSQVGTTSLRHSEALLR